MIKKWRPQGWSYPVKNTEGQTVYLKVCNCLVGQIADDYATFEAGADAMLEALKKKGTKVEDAEDGFSVRLPDIKFLHGIKRGTLVFIPDDEEKI